MFWRTALNRLTHALMIVTMVLHGILGCCWHHGHAAACASEARRVASPQAVPAETACCHHHGHDHSLSPDSPGSSGPDQQPGDPVDHEHECSDGACVYVGSKAPELSSPIPFQAFLGAEVGLLLKGPARNSVDRPVGTPPPHFRSSLASCALLQVWRL